MHLIRKILLGLSILLGLLVLGMMVFLFIFMNPNRFKSQIIHQIFVKTGIPVQIQGQIEWLLLPQLGLKIHHLLLPSAHVEEADIYIEWRGLLSRKIKVDKLFLKAFATETDKFIFKKTEHIIMKGDLQIDIPQKSFKIAPLNIDGTDIHALGNVSGKKINQGMQVEGQIKVPHFQGWPEFPVQTRDAVIRFKSNINNSFNGDVSVEQLNVKKYTLNNLSSPFLADVRKINFSQIKGKFSGGKVSGQVSISHFTVDPQYQMDIELKQIEMSQLLHSAILSGPADVNAHLILNDKLNGKMNFIMRNGVLNYIDLLKQIRDIRSFLKTSHFAVTANTQFSQLTASGLIENNIFTNHDLNLQSTDVQANGDGTVNLNNSQLEYILTVNAYGLKFPLKINGTLNKPKVKVDVSSFSIALPEKNLHNEIKSLFGHHHSSNSR